MGKHDKQATNFSWDPMPDDFYKARIKTLEQENLKLAEEVEKQKTFVAYATDRYTKLQEEYEASINELKADLGDLILENQSLRDAVVRAALREVE